MPTVQLTNTSARQHVNISRDRLFSLHCFGFGLCSLLFTFCGNFSGGADWKVNIKGPNDSEITVQTADNQDGSYSAHYELAALEGEDSTFVVTCTLDGKTVGNSPFKHQLGPKPSLAKRLKNLFKVSTDVVGSLQERMASKNEGAWLSCDDVHLFLSLQWYICTSTDCAVPGMRTNNPHQQQTDMSTCNIVPFVTHPLISTPAQWPPTQLSTH
jgi:hypothetical protein